MTKIHSALLTVAAIWTLARGWVLSHLRDVAFYARLGDEQGLKGLVTSWRMWRASKGLSAAYGHIERELALHEEHMALLRQELDKAQRDYQRARSGVHGLFVDKR